MERAMTYLRADWFETHFGSSQLSVSLIGKFIAVGMLLVVVSDVPSKWDIVFPIARLIIGVLIFAIIFLPVRPAAIILLLLLVAGRDFDIHPAASMWQMNISFIRPSWIVFGLIAVQLFKLRHSFEIPHFVRYLGGWFLIVPVVTGLFYGEITGGVALQQWIVDLKFPMMLFGVFLLFTIYLKSRPAMLLTMIAAFVGVLAARHLIDLVGFFAGIGPELDAGVAGITRVSEDSAKAAVVFFAFFGLLVVANYRSKIIWGLMIALPSFALMAAYGTRMIWIEFLVSIPIMIAVVKFRNAVVILAATAAMVIGGSGILYVTNQAAAERVYDRVTSITEGRPQSTFAVDVEYNLISRVDPIRYAEILNVAGTMNERKSWLWGNGYGGYYNDDVVDFPLDLQSSFPQFQLDNNKFYRTHNYFSQFFHKYGLIGLILITSIWAIPGYLIIRVIKWREVSYGSQEGLLYLVMLAMSVFLLTSMLEMTWSGKGYFINAIVLSIVVRYVLHHRSPDEKTWPPMMTRMGNWLK